MLQIEHDFTLPFGYVDEDGTLHREGPMRLATATDEILLSRVVTRLGTVEPITPRTIESLFAADLAHLQDLYASVNGLDGRREMVCPECHNVFAPTPLEV